VWHCPYCDGWEIRDQPLAACGSPREATGLALSLLTWTDRVTVCTNAEPGFDPEAISRLVHHGLDLRSERIVRLEGHDGRLERIIFAQGDPLACRAIFFNTGQFQRSPLAERMGCRFNELGHVCTDERGRTGVCNLFLAGDANGDVQFVVVAAGEGASTAVAINRELQEEDLQRRAGGGR
jgi:thioredoxin reductase